jgi:16S rRNA (guanine966-N2)-methyltransferase
VPDAGRVIAGRAKGRRLAAPGTGSRPLADRVKETLFAILEPDLPGAAVLDLFAGSGAAGIEALSRGASMVVFVDRDRTACSVIERNLRSTGLAGPAAVVRRMEALAYLNGPAAADAPFDVAVVDPPYEDVGLLEAALEGLGVPGTSGDGGLVAPGGRVVAKRYRRTVLSPTIGLLASDRERRFGETTLTFYRRVAGSRGAPDPGDAAPGGDEAPGVDGAPAAKET